MVSLDPELPLLFLVATKRLYKRVCPSVRRSVGRSVTLSLFGLLGATYGRVSGLVVVWTDPRTDPRLWSHSLPPRRRDRCPLQFDSKIRSFSALNMIFLPTSFHSLLLSVGPMSRCSSDSAMPISRSCYDPRRSPEVIRLSLLSLLSQMLGTLLMSSPISGARFTSAYIFCSRVNLPHDFILIHFGRSSTSLNSLEFADSHLEFTSHSRKLIILPIMSSLTFFLNRL